MERWPEAQHANTTRFVCKLYKSGTRGIYDFDNKTSITKMLIHIKPLICEKCNVDSVPSFLLFKDRTYIERITGANLEAVSIMLNKY